MHKAVDGTSAPSSSPSKFIDLFKTVLMYPTLLLAIGGSINIKQLWTWVSLEFSVPLSRVDESNEQRDLLASNLNCAATATAADHLIRVHDGVSIGAVVCDTGDVVIGAVDPASSNVGIPWVVPRRVIASKTQPNKNTADLLSALIGSAYAQPAPTQPQSTSTPSVICQRFIDNKVLLRRIQTGNTCVDEKSDVYTRQVLSREPVACSPTC
jgi:hypothetical protein